MPIRRARDPGALYEAVADHDLVICPDNALADAIDRRVTEPHFGTFATTPRRLATGRREPAEDRAAFLELVDEIDALWKAIAYAVGNVIQCWEHRGSHDAVLDYDAYVDDTTRAVVDAIADLDTTSRRLTEHAIAVDRSVAVVGESQLTPLERSILPEKYDNVDPFTAETYARPPFHVFDSTAAIVDAVLDTIEGEDPDRVAIVLDAGSRYSSLVESALAVNDVPYYGGPGFADDPDHRTFLRLLRAAHRGSDATVADVRPICSRIGDDVPIEHDAERVDAVDHRGLEWFTEFRAACDEMTFSGALSCFEHRLGCTLDAFREELTALGIADATVTPDRVADLAFYLRRYEVPVERDNDGVLLADAKSASFVDRPAVFHLGLDEGWTHSAPQRPWVDPDALFDRHLLAFQQLLQSGRNQYYLVQDTSGGRPVAPSIYLGELLDEEFSRFSDLESVAQPRVRSGALSTDSGFGFQPASVDAPSTQLETISQSSLNTYVNCPRDYFFSRLVESPDRDYFREGNLFHDFAEFYANHPDLVDDDGIDEIVDRIHDAASSFYHPDEASLRRRTYRIGVQAIAAFLDANLPEEEELDVLTPTSGWGTNPFAELFGVEVDSPLTERWFENVAIGAKGKIDLVCAPDRLVDHKSGSQKSARSVVRAATIDPPHDAPNFQAALYLSHFRTVNPDERIDFSFFHFLEPLDDAIAGDGELDAALADALTTVTYHPTTFDDFVASREAYDELLDHYKDCATTFQALGYDRYHEIVADRSFPETTDREELRASEFAAAFTAAVEAETGESVDAAKGCDQAIRKLNGYRKRAFFREDLDAFEEFLASCLDDVNDCRAGNARYPVDGPGGEPNYRYVDHRDLILEGQRDE